jgi:hypothetical protein
MSLSSLKLQDALAQGMAGKELDDTIAAAVGWGIEDPPPHKPTLFRLPLKFEGSHIAIEPSVADAVGAVLAAYDSIFPIGMPDPYTRMTHIGLDADVAMNLPAPSSPLFAAIRGEVKAIAEAMLRPLEHLAATFECGCIELMGIDVQKYVADWAGAGHTLDETLAEVVRVRKVLTITAAEAWRICLSVCCKISITVSSSCIF